MGLMEILELVSVVMQLAYVGFIAYEKKVGWILAAGGAAIGTYLMYRAGLKAEALLYFYYVLAGVYGYWEWSRPQNQLKDHVLIQKWPIKNHILTLAVGGVLAIGMAQLMMYINSSYPYADSLTTVFSFIATWLVVKRVLSNWVYWIIIDVASAYIYYLKGLNYYTGMMVIYTVLAVWGYYKWLQEYRVQKG